jgi:hypothetical protein
MRIISQNGKVDLPYECLGVEIDAINDTKIIAYTVNSDDDTIWKLAEYSTKEKAEKAMEELRTEYGSYRTVEGNMFYSAFDYPKVFRLPQDGDV